MSNLFSEPDNVDLPQEAKEELAELERELREGALRYNFRRFIFHIGENHSGSGLYCN